MPPSLDLILANRAYLDHEAPRWADSPTQAGSGGLLVAVRPVIQPWDGERGTTWIGAGMGRYDREWTDENGYELIATPRGPLRHRRLFFSNAAWRGHYGEVSNSYIWPLFHLVRADLPLVTGYYPAPATPAKADWDAHVAVNRSFAAAAAEASSAEVCWVHDYQLTLVPQMLRESSFAGRIAYFLHTPFPNMEVAARYLRGESASYFRAMVAGILGADLAGFQSTADVQRFVAAAVACCGARAVPDGVEIDGRFVFCGSFPVGIDPEEVLAVARTAASPIRVREARDANLPIVVGLERGDFTKGIPERLRAVATAYRGGQRFAYIGIAAPTREGVAAYDDLETTIEREAARAREAAFWAGCPFTQVRANVGWNDVVALQRDASVVFTSSLADGQNLVPFQTAIAQSLRPAGERGVIVAGRDAGVCHTFAGFENDGLVPVDPLDAAAMTTALTEALSGRPGRISDRLISEVRRLDALSWATGFLSNLEVPC